MNKSLGKYLPISDHRQEYVDINERELVEWIEAKRDYLQIYSEQISEILSDDDPINPEFTLVQKIGNLQLYWVSLAIVAVAQNDSLTAQMWIEKVLGGLSFQIPLHIYHYQDALAFFGPDEVGFGPYVDRSLLMACTAIWLGPEMLVRQSHEWFQMFRKNGHLMDHTGDACFREFTLWMLSKYVSAEPPDVDLDGLVYGPYHPLIAGFNSPSSLREEVWTASDFHLYRSDEFPGAESFPSFNGTTWGLFAAEIFAFGALRKRLTGIDTDLTGHPLLASAWNDVSPITQLAEPPFADEIKHRFARAFL